MENKSDIGNIVQFVWKVVKNIQILGIPYMVICMLWAWVMQMESFLWFWMTPYFSWTQMVADASIIGIVMSPLALLSIAGLSLWSIKNKFTPQTFKWLWVMFIITSLVIYYIIGMIWSFNDFILWKYMKSFVKRHESIISYELWDGKNVTSSWCVRGNDNWIVLFEHWDYKKQTLLPIERVITITNTSTTCSLIPKNTP